MSTYTSYKPGDIWFEKNTFFIVLEDNSLHSIVFDQEKQNNISLIIFQYFYEVWKEASDESGWIFVTKDEILRILLKNNIRGKTGEDVRRSVDNLRKKIRKFGLAKNVILNYFYNVEEGYPFKITTKISGNILR